MSLSTLCVYLIVDAVIVCLKLHCLAELKPDFAYVFFAGLYSAQHLCSESLQPSAFS